jgi:hypothetical protein
MLFKNENIDAAGYFQRSRAREVTMMDATMALLNSFVTDGDTEEVAKDKIEQLSNEVSANSPAAKYDFVLGNVQPLKDAVNASVLAFMTAAKKTIVLDILNQVTV